MITYHYLYKITNLVTNKFYFGVHTTTDLEDGYLGSGVIIKRSVAKYGAANHIREIIQFYDTREQLMDAEKQLVDEAAIHNPQCMNLRCGGRGGFTVAQQRINNERSQQAKKILRESDSKWVADVQSKHRVSMLQQYQTGQRVNTTKPHVPGEFQHTLETKARISESTKGKRSGAENSQFGTCWIHNIDLQQNKKINKSELSSYVELGWTLGRKMKF